jgi:holliday junction DNA helicase RuvA
MYAYIKGKLADIEEDSIVMEATGIGYRIYVPAAAFDSIASIGDEIKVYTYLQVREDAMQLFGFRTKEDLRIFKLLIAVSGVGPKAGLSILSALSTDELKFAILGGDAKAISRAQGIGVKTAQRVIIELKDKFSLEDTFEESFTVSAGQNLSNSSVKNDVMMALTALGYNAAEAAAALKRVQIEENSDVEEILKLVLKEML